MTGRALTWCRERLFNTPLNSVLTVLFLPLCIWLAGSLLYWAAGVARWGVVAENLRVLLVGTFPMVDIWRAWAALTILTLLVGLSLGSMLQRPGARVLAGWLAAVVIGLGAGLGTGSATPLWLLAALTTLLGGCALSWHLGALKRLGGLFWIVGIGGVWALLLPAGLDQWGGLMLSIIITILAAILSFPIGVLLALGRTSRLPVVRMLCVGYIELIRSLPLISVLYWAWIMVPLLMPGDLRVVNLVRGIAGFVFFYAAYVAEYVRGGLQNVPEGQAEASRSLGLNSFQTSYYVVLPQAIRAVIPGLVGNVLDIFNNVPLVFIIGLMDFVSAGQTVLSNPQYIGSEYEIYGFLFGVYLLISGLMTYASRKLERRMGVGER